MKTVEVETETGRRFKLRLAPAGCSHLEQIHDVQPRAGGCEECLKSGDDWVHLRLCLYCGHVGCCDSSKNRHATKHHQHTGHAIVQSLQSGEDWMYCYDDDVVMEPAG